MDEIKVNKEGMSRDEEHADGDGLLCTDASRLENNSEQLSPQYDHDMFKLLFKLFKEMFTQVY